MEELSKRGRLLFGIPNGGLNVSVGLNVLSVHFEKVHVSQKDFSYLGLKVVPMVYLFCKLDQEQTTVVGHDLDLRRERLSPQFAVISQGFEEGVAESLQLTDVRPFSGDNLLNNMFANLFALLCPNGEKLGEEIEIVVTY